MYPSGASCSVGISVLNIVCGTTRFIIISIHQNCVSNLVGLEKVKKTIKLPNNNVGEGTEKAI